MSPGSRTDERAPVLAGLENDTSGSNYLCLIQHVVGTDIYRGVTRDAGGVAATAGIAESDGTWALFTQKNPGAASRYFAWNDTFTAEETTSKSPTGVDSLVVGIFYNAGSVTQVWGDNAGPTAVWGVALSDAEITSLSKGRSPKTLQNFPVHCYSMLHGSGDEIDTVGGSSYNLAETGTVLLSGHKPQGWQ